MSPQPAALARSCPDVEQVFARTNKWWVCYVRGSDSYVTATVHPDQQKHEWRWDQHGNEKEHVTSSAALAALVKQALDGKPGSLSLGYMGMPSRGSFRVQVSAEGKIQSVDDFKLSD